MALVKPMQGDRTERTATDGVRGATALLEVMGVYVVGQIVGFIVASLLGIPLTNPLLNLTASASSADLRQITLQVLWILLAQYAGLFSVAFLVGWWHRRRTPAQYGLRLAGRPLSAHLLTGVVLFAFSELPVKILDLVNSITPLGTDVVWRSAIFAMDWSSLEFWLLMAVSSFALIPVVEELFYRGYGQTRLAEDLGAPAAIMATAALFTFSHSQYYTLDGLNLTRLVFSALAAVAWGYAFYRSRSLVPVIVVHVLVNVPLRGIGFGIEVLLMILICVVARREIAGHLREFRDLMRGMTRSAGLAGAGLMLFAIGFALLNDITLLLGIGFFVAALILEWREKRRIAALSA